MESALVCGEYSSGEENTELKGRDNHCDVNYDEVGMDMGSSCSSGQEDEGFNNKEENIETSHSVDEGLFSSKEEYEAYQNQFKSGPPEIDNKETEFQEDPNMESEYGRSRNEKMNKDTHSDYGEDNVEKDEYGGWQPSSKNKSKNTRSCETSPSSAREPHRRTNHLKRSDDDENFMSREEIKQKQPQKR